MNFMILGLPHVCKIIHNLWPSIASLQPMPSLFQGFPALSLKDPFLQLSTKDSMPKEMHINRHTNKGFQPSYLNDSSESSEHKKLLRSYHEFYKSCLELKLSIMEKKFEKKLMETLLECLARVNKQGYTENFMANENGLIALTSKKVYSPLEITIPNYFRFEGETNPDDSSILYLIDTKDGVKGILTDAYGAYADTNVNKFITEVEEISKK
jgi:hypothetical protein